MIIKRVKVNIPLEDIKKYPSQIGQPDHNLFDLSDDYSVLFMVLNRPSDHEISQIKSGTLVVRLTLFEGCLWLTFKCGDLDWGEAPYNPHLSLQIHSLPKSLATACKTVYLILVDSSDGSVVYCKRHKFPDEFSLRLEKSISYLYDKEFNRDLYFHFLGTVQAQYSTPQIADVADCECILSECQ